jgi:hypothetical protein
MQNAHLQLCSRSAVLLQPRLSHTLIYDCRSSDAGQPSKRHMPQLCYSHATLSDARPFCARRPQEMNNNNNRHAKLAHATPVRAHNDHPRH